MMAPLPETAATHVDASSTSAASVYSCSVPQTDVRHARSTFSQHLKHHRTLQVLIDEQAASCSHCYTRRYFTHRREAV